jgi:uncharacterized protein
VREIRLAVSRGRVLRALVPETRRERVRGLLGRSSLAADDAVLFERTRSIHTYGMRIPIMVALLDEGLVVRSVRLLRPGRLLLPRPDIRHVLECAEGVDLRVGDQLRIVRAD